MRIISKTNDYYDSVQAYGLDSDLVYVRETAVFEDSAVRDAFNFDPEIRSFYRAFLDRFSVDGIVKERGRRFGGLRLPSLQNISIELYVIGFCGELYPCVRVHEFSSFYTGDHRTLEKKPRFFFYGDEEDLAKELFGPENEITDVIRTSHEKTKKKLNRFLKMRFKSSTDIFHYYKAPIVAFNLSDFYSLSKTVDRAVVNPLLSEFKFYRVKDAFSAFQEIAQYMSGVLGNLGNDTISISDKDMRDAKGFDSWSFKTRPTKTKS